MDAYDSNFRNDSQIPPVPDPDVSHDSPVTKVPPEHRRKASPYENSPYENWGSKVREENTYQPQSQPPERPPRKNASGRGRRFLAIVLTVALVAAGCWITASSVNRRWEARTAALEDSLTQQIQDLQEQLDNQTVAVQPGISSQPLPEDGSSLTPSQLYAANVDSVVAISSTVETSDYYYGSGEATSTGSGFLFSQDGYVVTNYHVVEGASAVEVAMYDGSEYPAQVVGYDATNDIAVLKIDGENLPAASIGQSGSLSIGDMVVAIGNPLGQLAATQTVGYVSGINREVATDSTILSMIQTDAAINPGNSGGPLFNMYGQVIGITTAKYSGMTNSGASIEGIGFAIPIDDVMPIINDLISYGYVTGAYIGVTVQNTDADSAAMFGLPTGAYVLEVVEGGSADRAGIQVKDIIIDLGGNTVSNVTELTRALRKFQAGDTTTVTVIRSGKEITLDITLDEKPQELPEETQPAPDDGGYSSDPFSDWFSWYFGS